jgi:hypothetical protein
LTEALLADDSIARVEVRHEAGLDLTIERA